MKGSRGRNATITAQDREHLRGVLLQRPDISGQELKGIIASDLGKDISASYCRKLKKEIRESDGEHGENAGSGAAAETRETSDALEGERELVSVANSEQQKREVSRTLSKRTSQHL